jgi:spermidine synthase
MSQNKLDIRKVPGGTSFYIDGSLQFDTRDEFIYHEMLVLPAASLFTLRSKRPFHALILGGGDGLALRELLKFDRLKRVDLIDYDPEVIRYGKTKFAAWNQGAFRDKRVSVAIEEAGHFLRSCRKIYDLIVADFTFPDDLASCHLFTEGFYSLMRDRLSPKGVAAINTVSPEMSPPAYWSIFKTLSSLGLHPRPLRVPVPSFASHGYGDWGFSLASKSPILLKEIKSVKVSVPTRYMKKKALSESMKFSKQTVLLGMSLAKVLKQPSDLLCFLNMPIEIVSDDGRIVDFSRRLSAEELRLLGMNQTFAISEFTPEWYERIVNVLRSLDWETFFDEVEKSFKDGFQKLSDQFKALKEELPELLQENVFNRENLHKLMALLLILIVFINTVFPDNAYAKGYYGGGHSHGYTNSQQSGGEVQPILMAPVAVAAFYGLGKNGAVPDVNGKPHASKPVALLDGSGIIRNKKALFALADDIYVSESGEVWMTGPGLPYYYQVGDHGFTLFWQEHETPIFEFAPDPQLAKALLRNVEVQQKALDRTLKDYERWLSWARPAQIVSKGMREESREITKLKLLKKTFESLYEKFMNMTSSSGVVDFASYSPVLPGVYLSKQGNILLRKMGGFFENYPLAGSREEPGISMAQADENMTLFLNTALKWAASRPGLNVRIKQILEAKMAGKETKVAEWN